MSYSIGGDMILSNHGGSPLKVAEDLILGKVKPYEMQFANEVVNSIILETAKIRLEALGMLNEKHVLPAKED